MSFLYGVWSYASASYSILFHASPCTTAEVAIHLNRLCSCLQV